MTHAESKAMAREHRRDYESGMTCAEIGAACGLTGDAVRRRLINAGTVMRSCGNRVGMKYDYKENMKRQDIPRILAACRQTGNQSLVARQFGLSRQRVSQFVKRYAGIAPA